MRMIADIPGHKDTRPQGHQLKYIEICSPFGFTKFIEIKKRQIPRALASIFRFLLVILPVPVRV